MLKLTVPAQKQFKAVMDSGDIGSTRLRVFIDHRCHCGKAHFNLAIGDNQSPDDAAFEVDGIPFVADTETAPELPSVEIDFVETVWTKGFTIRNVNHNCGPHMMD